MNIKKVWSDGSCFPNPGNGGWAWATECGKSGAGKATEKTTNQRMEMTAAIEAMKALGGREHTLIIITDSQYVIKGSTVWRHSWERNGWINSQNKPVVNRDLWETISELMGLYNIKFQWVKGHNGDAMNEKVDQLAGAQIGLKGHPFIKGRIKEGEVYG